jgi:hypothetical protein
MATTNGQMNLDWQDSKAGARARDRAIDQVERGSGEWQVEAVSAIRRVAAVQPELTTDDVWRALGRDPDVEGRAMGAAMRQAAKLGLIKRTDRTTKSARVACHRRDLRVWVSRICP